MCVVAVNYLRTFSFAQVKVMLLYLLVELHTSSGLTPYMFSSW